MFLFDFFLSNGLVGIIQWVLLAFSTAMVVPLGLISLSHCQKHPQVGRFFIKLAFWIAGITFFVGTVISSWIIYEVFADVSSLDNPQKNEIIYLFVKDALYPAAVAAVTAILHLGIGLIGRRILRCTPESQVHALDVKQVKKLKDRGSAIIMAVGAIVAFGIPIAFTIGWNVFTEHARLEWAQQAITAISLQAEDQAWIRKEIQAVKSSDDKSTELLAEGWLSRNMILMENGEWLIYRSHCNKRAPHYIKDIFIAKASDGNWYYSNCHFCVDMLVIIQTQNFEAPYDLQLFKQVYRLHRFDGTPEQGVNMEAKGTSELSPDCDTLYKGMNAREARQKEP